MWLQVVKYSARISERVFHSSLEPQWYVQFSQVLSLSTNHTKLTLTGMPLRCWCSSTLHLQVGRKRQARQRIWKIPRQTYHLQWKTFTMVWWLECQLRIFRIGCPSRQWPHWCFQDCQLRHYPGFREDRAKRHGIPLSLPWYFSYQRRNRRRYLHIISWLQCRCWVCWMVRSTRQSWRFQTQKFHWIDAQEIGSGYRVPSSIHIESWREQDSFVCTFIPQMSGVR